MDISAEVAAIQAASEGSELRQPIIDALTTLNSGTLPVVTASDTGKILKVSEAGQWEVGEKSEYIHITQADEGKVVYGGALVEQTARSSQITQNGTFDTTRNNSVTVNISGGEDTWIDPTPNLPSGYQRVQYLDFYEAYFSVSVPTVGLWRVTFSSDVGQTTKAQSLFAHKKNTSNLDDDAQFRIAVDLSDAYMWVRGDSGYVNFTTITSLEVNKIYKLWGFMNITDTQMCYIGTYNPQLQGGIDNKFPFYGKIYEIMACVPSISPQYVFTKNCAFVPCYRKSDDQVGLYDAVNGIFYTPIALGTGGSVTAGPDVN